MRGGDDDDIEQTRHTILLFPRVRQVFIKLRITLKILRILIEHIEMKHSLESQLQIEYICFIQIFNIFRAIRNEVKSQNI